MTSQIPPRSLRRVKGVQVDKARLRAAGASDATSPSSMLRNSQKSVKPPFTESLNEFAWFSLDDPRRPSVEQTDARYLASYATESAASTAADDEQGILSTFYRDGSQEVPMSEFTLEQGYQLPRYYTKALSEDDIHALVRGKKNHNLKNWSAEDMVDYHKARKNLIPLVMPKVDKMNALAGIEHDRQRAMNNRVRPAFRIPRIRVTDHKKENGEATSSPMKSSSSPRDGDSLQHASFRARAASSGDYLPRHPGYRNATNHHRRISPLAPSSPSSDSSTRVRSPLKQEVQFRHDPEVTFDAFLVPHKSGKGEILPGAVKAKKPRLRKMPSMPLLRKRGQLD